MITNNATINWIILGAAILLIIMAIFGIIKFLGKAILTILIIIVLLGGGALLVTSIIGLFNK